MSLTRCASAGSLVVTRPPSPNAPRFLLGKNEKQPERAEPASRSILVARADGLRRVFDHGDACAVGHGEDRVHVRGAAVQVHGHDRLGPGRQRGFDRRRVDVVGDRVDVDQDGRRAETCDASCRGEERVGGRDDLVARADAKRHHRGQQGVRAGRHPDGLPHLQHLGEFPLEAVDLGTANEPLAVADPGDGGEDFFSNGLVLGLEIQQGHTCDYRRHRFSTPKEGFAEERGTHMLHGATTRWPAGPGQGALFHLESAGLERRDHPAEHQPGARRRTRHLFRVDVEV